MVLHRITASNSLHRIIYFSNYFSSYITFKIIFKITDSKFENFNHSFKQVSLSFFTIPKIIILVN